MVLRVADLRVAIETYYLSYRRENSEGQIEGAAIFVQYLVTSHRSYSAGHIEDVWVPLSGLEIHLLGQEGSSEGVEVGAVGALEVIDSGFGCLVMEIVDALAMVAQILGRTLWAEGTEERQWWWLICEKLELSLCL